MFKNYVHCFLKTFFWPQIVEAGIWSVKGDIYIFYEISHKKYEYAPLSIYVKKKIVSHSSSKII